MPSTPLPPSSAKIKAVHTVFWLRNQHITKSKMFLPTGNLVLEGLFLLSDLGWSVCALHEKMLKISWFWKWKIYKAINIQSVFTNPGKKLKSDHIWMLLILNTDRRVSWSFLNYLSSFLSVSIMSLERKYFVFLINSRNPTLMAFFDSAKHTSLLLWAL